MSEEQLEDFTKTKRKKLPAKKATNIQSKFTPPRDGFDPESAPVPGADFGVSPK